MMQKTLNKKTLARRSLLQPQTIVVNLFLIVYSLTAVFPPLWMLYNSFKRPEEFLLNIFSLPSEIYVQNYVDMYTNGTVFRAMLNSLLASSVSVLIIVVLAFLVGYVLARYVFRGRRVVSLFFMFGLLIPVHALLIPIFIQFKAIGMLNNQFTIIPPMVAFGMPVAIFLVEGYVAGIPVSIEESAFIDGSSQMRAIFSLIIPMSTPIVATIVIVSSLQTWNEFGIPLVLLRSPALRTIPLWLRSYSGEFTSNYTGLLSALFVSSIPVVTLYIAFHDRIIRGMTQGAVKG